MTRYTFGGTYADMVLKPNTDGSVRYGPGAVLTFWTAKTAGTQYTDLLLAGSPVTSITADTNGIAPVYSGPDGITSMWASADGGPRFLVYSPVSSLGFMPVITPEAYGAVGDGIADDTTPWNNAAATALASGGLLSAQGTYKTTGTVVIACNADVGRATLNYAGTGVAVQLGVGTSAVYLFSKTIVCPRVINTSKVGTGWTGSTVGIKAINTLQCTITVPYVKNFVTGYYAYGLGTGNVGNDVFLRSLENNKRNFAAGAGTGGWSNSNKYYIGWLAHFSAEGSNVSGVRQIELETATNDVNGNMFIGGTIEGSVPEYHIDCDGRFNRFIELRYEDPLGARVRWKAGARNNVLDGGVNLENVVETHTAGSRANHRVTSVTTYHNAYTTLPIQVLENEQSGGLPSDAVMDPGSRAANADPTTAYRVLRGGNDTKMKQATDAFPRLTLNHDTGRILMGFGTAAPVITWHLGTGSPEGVITAGIGSLYSNVSGGASTTLYVKTSGTGNTGWTAK